MHTRSCSAFAASVAGARSARATRWAGGSVCAAHGGGVGVWRSARRGRARVRMAAGDDAPNGRVISTALEVSFRTVWIQLLTAGVGEAYEAAIADFVVACVAARKAGYTVTTLKLELAANELGGGSPEMEKIRLNDREKETRIIWMSIVFMTLKRYGFVAGSAPVDDRDVFDHFQGAGNDGLVRGLNTLVESVCDAADRGYNLSTYKMELNLNRKQDADAPSPATLSIQSQWARMVFATINILPDALTEARRKK